MKTNFTLWAFFTIPLALPGFTLGQQPAGIVLTEQKRQELRKLADATLEAPKLNTSPGPEYAIANLEYGMTIGIERTPGGRLVAAWIGGEDGPGAYMLVSRSDDDGFTWTDPILLINGQSDDLSFERSVIIGNLWTDPNGKLWIFFDQTMQHFDGRAGLWAAYCENPDAEKMVWSNPVRLFDGAMLNKPLVTSDGEWMLFSYLLHADGFHQFKGKLFPELDPIRGVNLLVSNDEGKTWQHRATVPTHNREWIEAMGIERKNGDLWLLARTSKGIAESTSSDKGQTWTVFKKSPTIAHPSARFFVQRLASGNLLLIKHGTEINKHTGREALSAWLSVDDGATWSGGLVIDHRKNVSYPDGFQAPDGSIYISYDWRRGSKGHILYAKFTEADVIAAELVNQESRIMQPIMIPGRLNHRDHQ
ncbi:MAG: sialidase family protein [Planctomycetota bacterium]|nr:hypothetical protein [Planctomycetaceae bacterium]MDP6930226.1 sialidase family protein [Planctomycetota bacterium]